MIEQKNLWIRNRDIIFFISLLFFTVLSVYYFHPLINKAYFLFILFIIWRSSKNYFWICFFMIIASTPFNLFSEGSGQVLHRIPVYDFYGRFGLDFKELFLIIFSIKAYKKGNASELFLKSEYNIILIWLAFLWIVTYIIGVDFWNLIKFGRQILYLTLFYSVPRLLEREKMYMVFKIFSIITVLYFIDQILSVATGISIAKIIKDQDVVIHTDFIRTSSRMFSPQFFTFILGFYFLSSEKEFINKKMIIAFMIIAYLSIFVTGTRGWIIVYTFVFIYYLKYISLRKVKTIVVVSAMLVILGTVLFSFQITKQLVLSTTRRMNTLAYLSQGDLTANGSLNRLTVRLPRLIQGIRQSPVIGLGFSNSYQLYHDGHVGWANQVLQIGLIGLFLFIFLWIKYWEVNISLSQSVSEGNPYKKSILVLNAGLLCLLIIHSTSSTVFNFSMPFQVKTMVFMYFIFSDILLKEALILEENIDG